MDTSLFSQLQGRQVAAAHAVGTSLTPRTGTTSNLGSGTGTTVRATPTTATGKAAAAAATGSTTGTSAASSGASATADGATITSSDFLTLLVTELQNQDPTQPTDPNEYITQLVGVNSLEELISINSGITSLDTAATGAANTTGTTDTSGAASPEALSTGSVSTGTGSSGAGTAGSGLEAGQAAPASTFAPSHLHRPTAASLI